MVTENKQDQYDEKLWSSVFGFGEDLDVLAKIGRARHSVVVNSFDGHIIRAQQLAITRQDKTRFQISADYLYHAGNINNYNERFFNVDFEKSGGKVKMVGAHIMGAKQNVNDPEMRAKIAEVSKELFKKIARRKEWANPIELLRQSGIDLNAVKHESLPGLLPNGDLKSAPRLKNTTETKRPVFPAQYLDGLIGSSPEYYGAKGAISRSITIPGENGAVNILTMTSRQGKTPLHVDKKYEITRHTSSGIQTEPLYEVKTGPYKGKKNLFEIKNLALYTPNRTDLGKTLEEIDLQHAPAAAVALENIQRLDRLIETNPEALRTDLMKKPQDRRLFLPSDIAHISRLDKIIETVPPAPKKIGRMTFTVLGGNGTEKIVSDYDKNIGGNSYKINYYKPGETRASSLIADAGALFHDQFNLTFNNIGKLLKHKDDKFHVPESDVLALMFTHMHEDHMGQIPLLVKKGYVLPTMVMPPLLFFKLQRKMSELGIDAATRKEVENSCYVVDSRTDFDTRNAKREVSKWVAGQKITQGTERLPSNNFGEYEHFPKLQIGPFKIRVGPMPHSDPGNMYDFITPAASHRHTGDYKYDETIEVRPHSFLTWLQGLAPDSMSADSTGALRPPTELTPKEAEIGASIAKLMKENPENRFIYPTLGSNSSRLKTLIAAMGHAKKPYLIVDGKALKDLIHDLDNAYQLHRKNAFGSQERDADDYGIRRWAEEKYGVEIVLSPTKRATQLMANEKPGNLVLALTGSQDEPYSSLNRSLRDWLPANRVQITSNDIIVPLQGPIPVGNNEWRRQGMAYFAKNFFGAKVILPEVAKLEIENMKLAGSGHADPVQMVETYFASKLPVILPVHGGPDHLAANARIAESTGAESRVLAVGEEVEICAGKKVKPFRFEGSQFVGIRFNNAADRFWDKRNFRSTIIETKPQDRTLPGQLIASFEKDVRKMAGLEHELPGASLSALSLAFNRVSPPGFLEKKLEFGVEKHGRDIFTEKNISLLAGVDNETAGKHKMDPVTQFAMMAVNLDGRTIDKCELHQAVPKYHIEDPEASMVTRTHPAENRKGLHPIVFASRIEENIEKIKKLSQNQYQKDHPQEDSVRVKVPLIAHNMRFDDRKLQKTFGDALHDQVRPHVSDGMIGVCTRTIARALHATMPEKFHVVKKTDSDFLDFTLKSLCENNRIPYDERQAHNSAMYDTGRAIALFQRQNKLAPDIVGQMLINGDVGSNELLDDMRGMNLPFGGSRPVFSYVSPLAIRPDLRIGALIGTLGNNRYAVVANLDHSPADLLHKSDQDILKILKDGKDDRLELINLQEQPIILPAAYYFKTPQGRHVARESIDQHAAVIGNHLNTVAQESGWKNLAERLDDIWDGNAGSILYERTEAVNDNEPDLQRALPLTLPSGHTPDQDAIENRRRRAQSGFDPVKRVICQENSTYQKAARLYLDAKPAIQAATLENLSRIYKQAAQHTPNKDSLLLHNLHYDIAKKDLSDKDRQRVENWRNWRAHETITRAKESIERLQKKAVEEPGIFSLKERRLLNDLVTFVAQQEAENPLTEGGRRHIHSWRAITRAQEDLDEPKFTAA